MRTIRLLLKYTIITIICTFFVDQLVKKNTSDKIYTSTKTIPYNKVGLLLGTSKKLWNGRNNLYYFYRINATVILYKSKKIKYILISGDNSNQTYDEPTTMKEDLIKRGVPSSRIFLDYAGFRTWDSIIRCKEIFGQDRITVISQQFHNERALFIAQYHDIDAIGFNAKDVSKRYGFKVMVREKIARVKVILDIIFNVQPKFLGEKITIS